ncbi:hypothetical protein F4680DRAFT_467639 [Xylaria scruposa]|nr:hypothetical protein F4680DRAFT_467639 [Xylaria scruposa]
MVDSASGNTSTVYPVHIGFWTNWSYGRLQGSTLTLSQTQANLLVAFVALYVRFVLGRFWAICCMSLHIVFSSKTPQDGAYHQRQVALRNSSDPITVAPVLVQIWWRWRKRKSTTKLLPFLAFIVLLWGFTAVASVFSANIALNSEVLLSGHACRILSDEGDPFNRTRKQPLWRYKSKWATNSADYAQQCYLYSAFSGKNCVNSPFVQQQLPMIVNQSAECPFHPSICSSQYSNLLIDTAYLDSHHDLGVNAPPDKRIKLRARLHCGPLVTAGYTDDFKSRKYKRYFYGKTISSEQNETYVYQQQNFSHGGSMNTATPTYTIQYRYYYHRNGHLWGPWSPIPKLHRKDADGMILFLSSNGIAFTQPTKDLWYNSSQIDIVNPDWDVDLANDPSVTRTWHAEAAASPLGCAIQIQYCFGGKTGTMNCTRLSSIGMTNDQIESWAIEEKQKSLFRSMRDIIAPGYANILDVIATLDRDILVSRVGTYAGWLGPIADNQWQLDMENLFSIWLATIQRRFLNAALGEVPDDLSFSTRPRNEADEMICTNQKIISTVHISFSVLGLSIIFFSGIILLIVSYSLEACITWAKKRWAKDPYSQYEWRLNGLLQLQRLAHEEIGIEPWSRCDETVPDIRDGLHLAVVDSSDNTHPTLRRPMPEDYPSQAKGNTSNSNEAASHNDTTDTTEEAQTQTLESETNVPLLRTTSFGNISLD